MKRTRNLYHFQVRKAKKAENKIKASRLLDACLNDDTDLFKEIKKHRKVNAKVVNSIDGKFENISEHFADIYENLYNSVDDDVALTDIKDEIENKIDKASINDVLKVTPEIIKKQLEI